MSAAAGKVTTQVTMIFPNNFLLTGCFSTIATPAMLPTKICVVLTDSPKVVLNRTVEAVEI